MRPSRPNFRLTSFDSLMFGDNMRYFGRWFMWVYDWVDFNVRYNADKDWWAWGRTWIEDIEARSQGWCLFGVLFMSWRMHYQSVWIQCRFIITVSGMGRRLERLQVTLSGIWCKVKACSRISRCFMYVARSRMIFIYVKPSLMGRCASELTIFADESGLLWRDGPCMPRIQPPCTIK